MNVPRLALLTATLFLIAAEPERSLARETPCEALTKTLTNGVVVTIRPTTKNGPAEAGCETFVYDAGGKTLFDQTSFSAAIHPATGRDLDDDGRPDLVIRTESSTANLNFGITVIFLGRTRTTTLSTGPATFDFETARGHNLMWTPAAFYDLQPDPNDPVTVQTVRELGKNGLADVTAAYCSRMLAGELRGPGDLRELLNALPSRSKQASRTETGSSFEREQTRAAARSIALQQIYCGQIADASQLILEVWPAAEQPRIRRQIKDAINSRWPDLARKMGNF